MPASYSASQLILFHSWLIDKPTDLFFEFVLNHELFKTNSPQEIKTEVEDLFKKEQPNLLQRKRPVSPEPAMPISAAKRLKYSGPNADKADSPAARDNFIFEDQADYDNFSKFLNFFETAYVKQNDGSLPSPYRIVLDYLISNHPLSEIDPAKLAQLFKQLLITSPQEALLFYSTDKLEDLICESSIIGLPLVQVMFDYTLEKTELILGRMPNPLRLVPLFLDSFVDNPEQMAAFIVWLLSQSVSVKDLIASRILDKFFEYHCSLLDPQNYPLSPLYRLYALLKNNGAEALVMQAEITPVIDTEIENLDSPLRGYEKYTLRGMVNPSMPSKDTAIETVGTITIDETIEESSENKGVITPIISSNITPMETEVNIPIIAEHIMRKTVTFGVPIKHDCQAYHTFFGQPYLHRLVRFYANQPKAPHKKFLHSIFNDTSAKGLKILSNLLILINKTTLDQSLFVTINALLDVSTFDEHIGANNFTVFYLVPSNLELLDKLQPEILKGYLDKLDLSKDYTFENLALLNTLLKYLQKNHPASMSIKLIFEKMLALIMADTTLYYPEIIDNLNYLTEISRYYEQAIQIKALEIENTLCKFLVYSDFSPSSINEFMGKWPKLLKQFNLLQEICPNLIMKDFPLKKYELHIKIVSAAWKKDPQASTLATVINTLTPFEQPPANAVSEQGAPEHAVSDYERLLIEILLTIDKKNLRLAVIDLLTTAPCSNPKWLDQKYNAATIFELALARENEELINHLMTLTNQFSQSTIDAAFCAATQSSWVLLVKKFLDMTGDNKPSITAVDNALEDALENVNLALIQLFIVMTADNKPSQAKIDRTLINALDNGLEPIVKTCIELTTENKPSQTTIDAALVKTATTQWALVARLLAMPGENKPSQTGVHFALNAAVEARNLKSIQIILNLSEANKPNQSNVDANLTLLLPKLENCQHIDAKEFAILEQFLNMTEDNKPSPRCKAAAARKISTFLLNLSSQTTHFYVGTNLTIKIYHRLMPSIIPARTLCKVLLKKNPDGLNLIDIIHRMFGSPQEPYGYGPNTSGFEFANGRWSLLPLEYEQNTQFFVPTDASEAEDSTPQARSHKRRRLTFTSNDSSTTLTVQKNESQLLYQIYLAHHEVEPVCKPFIEKCLKTLAEEAHYPEALMALALIAEREGDKTTQDAYKQKIIKGAAPDSGFFTQRDPICRALVSATPLAPDNDIRNVSTFIETFNTDIRRIFEAPDPVLVPASITKPPTPAIPSSHVPEDSLPCADEDEDLNYQISI